MGCDRDALAHTHAEDRQAGVVGTWHDIASHGCPSIVLRRNEDVISGATSRHRAVAF